MSIQLKVPDIGDFEQVEIIEVIVKAGESIKKNDPVVTLESDKSSVEVPSTVEGKISNINVSRRNHTFRSSLSNFSNLLNLSRIKVL